MCVYVQAFRCWLPQSLSLRSPFNYIASNYLCNYYPSTPWAPYKTASSLLIFVLFYHCCWWSWLQSLSSILAPWQRPKKTTNTNVYRLHVIRRSITSRPVLTHNPLLFSYLPDWPDSDAPRHFHDQARGEVFRGQAEHTAHYLSITIDIARGWLHRRHSA